MVKMTDDFKCPFCDATMIDIEGHYICVDCNFVNGDDFPPQTPEEYLEPPEGGI